MTTLMKLTKIKIHIYFFVWNLLQTHHQARQVWMLAGCIIEEFEVYFVVYDQVVLYLSNNNSGLALSKCGK